MVTSRFPFPCLFRCENESASIRCLINHEKDVSLRLIVYYVVRNDGGFCWWVSNAAWFYYFAMSRSLSVNKNQQLSTKVASYCGTQM